MEPTPKHTPEIPEELIGLWEAILHCKDCTDSCSGALDAVRMIARTRSMPAGMAALTLKTHFEACPSLITGEEPDGGIDTKANHRAPRYI